MSKIINNPHDRTTKLLLSDKKLARAFFNQHLPTDIKAMTDLTALQPCKGTFVDTVLREHLTDILYKTKMCGKQGYIYLLIEAQSTPDKLMPFRLHQYMIAVMRQALDEQEKRKEKPVLPLVYPMVYYTGKYRYKESTDLFSLFEQPELAKSHFLSPFKLIDLSQLSDEELKSHTTIRGMELIQKHIYHRDLMQVVDTLLDEGILLEIEQQNGEHLEIMLKYIVNNGEIGNVDKFIKKITTRLPEQSEALVTAAQQLKNQGMQQREIEIAKKLLLAGQSLVFTKEITGLTNKQLETINTEQC